MCTTSVCISVYNTLICMSEQSVAIHGGWLATPSTPPGSVPVSKFTKFLYPLQLSCPPNFFLDLPMITLVQPRVPSSTLAQPNVELCSGPQQSKLFNANLLMISSVSYTCTGINICQVEYISMAGITYICIYGFTTVNENKMHQCGTHFKGQVQYSYSFSPANVI